MSYVVNASTDTFSRGQDHSGSVQVSVCGKAAVRAPESPFGQSQACLSLAAPRTRHRRVGGRHQHNRSARPLTTLDQLCLGCADRSIGALAGHRGPGQELRFEVLDSDGLVVVDDSLCPDPAVMLVLVRGFLVQLRGFPLGALVAIRCSGTLLVTSAHLLLGLRQLGRATPPVCQSAPKTADSTSLPPLAGDEVRSGTCYLLVLLVPDPGLLDPWHSGQDWRLPGQRSRFVTFAIVAPRLDEDQHEADGCCEPPLQRIGQVWSEVGVGLGQCLRGLDVLTGRSCLGSADQVSPVQRGV